MNQRAASAVVLTLLVGLFDANAGAAQEIHAGAHLSYGSEDFSELGVGVHGTYLVTDEIAGWASFTYHFPGEDVTFWDLNINGHYRFEVAADVTPYVGAGINYSSLSVDVPGLGFGTASTSEVGLNALGGAFMDMDNGMRPFGELRFVFSDADQLVLTLGLSVPVGNGNAEVP